MQPLTSLASRLKASISPHLAHLVENAPSLSAAAATLASQRIADPHVWSEVLTLAQTATVSEKSDISLAALTAGKFYHSRVLHSLTADFSAMTSTKDVIAALKVVQRLPPARTRGIFARASEKLQTMEISDLREISEIISVFRRSPDERLFSILLKKIGKKISRAEVPDCTGLLENMGRARIRDLRTIHALVEKILADVSNSAGSGGSVETSVRMLHSLDKLKVIHGRDRLVQRFMGEVAAKLSTADVLKVAAAMNAVGADTRKLVKCVLDERGVQLGDLEKNMELLRAICGSNGPAVEDVLDLLGDVLVEADADELKECAEIFLAHVGMVSPVEQRLGQWETRAVKKLLTGVKAVVEAPQTADHVCAVRLRNSVKATVNALAQRGELHEVVEVMGSFATVKVGRGTGSNGSRKKKKVD